MTNDDVARWLGLQLLDWPIGDGPRGARPAADGRPGHGPVADGPMSSEARLYGLTVLDDRAIVEGRSGGARFVAVAEGDPYALLAGPARLARTCHDALALVASGRIVERPVGAVGAVVDPQVHPRAGGTGVERFGVGDGVGASHGRGDGGDECRGDGCRGEVQRDGGGLGVGLVIVMSTDAAPGYWLRRDGYPVGITPEDPSGDLPLALLAWRRVPST